MNNFSLNTDMYRKEFETIDELIEDIAATGMDPNYEITKDGIPTGETAWEMMEGFL